MENPTLFKSLPCICSLALQGCTRLLTATLLDNITGIIFVDDIFRLGRVDFLSLLGTVLAKRGLFTATSGFLFGHEP
jgi:hypothetical protein